MPTRTNRTRAATDDSGVRDRAVRLADALQSASKDFDGLGKLPAGPERDRLFRAVHALASVAVPWLASCSKRRRSERQAPGPMTGWVGCD